MDKTIYKYPELVKIIEEQKYKFCSLHNLDGEIVVPFNSLGKGAQTVKKKLEEIKTRSLRLPPGIYCLVCKSVYGTNAKGDKYYLGIGKYDPLSLNDAPQVNERERKQPEEKLSRKSPEYLLSMETALDNMRELAELKADNARLSAENKKLKDEVAQLEAELEEEPETNLSDANGGLGAMFKDLLPVLDPLATKYFELEEKKLNFNQAKFLSERGYEIPGMKKINGNGHAKSRPGKVVEQPREIPEPGAEGWEQYIQVLLNMPEETFNQHLAQLKQHAPETYEQVVQEVFEEGEEN